MIVDLRGTRAFHTVAFCPDVTDSYWLITPELEVSLLSTNVEPAHTLGVATETSDGAQAEDEVSIELSTE